MANMTKDIAGRFVSPVTLTDASGSYIGTSGSPLSVTGSLGIEVKAADIEIGAVEIKNATTDDRAKVDASGFLYVSASRDSYTPNFYHSTAFESGSMIKASVGSLYGFSGYNSKESSQFIQIHNSATQPANTSVPSVLISVPASSNFSWDSGKYATLFDTGIWIANSSTGPTLTSGSEDVWFNVLYE